jgi:predicted AAA+ superfamily ATPase
MEAAFGVTLEQFVVFGGYPGAAALAHYLELLAAAGMLTGLSNGHGHAVRRRGSSPKLQVLSTAFMTAMAGRESLPGPGGPVTWVRCVESAVGAHLASAAAGGACELFYWRGQNREMDFVLRKGRALLAIEVKSGHRHDSLSGLSALLGRHPKAKPLLVGADGVPLDGFPRAPVTRWLEA